MNVRISCTFLTLVAALSTSAVSASVLQYQITNALPSTDELFVDTSMPDLDPDPTVGSYAQPASFTPPGPPASHSPFYGYFVYQGPTADRIQIVHGYTQTVGPGHPNFPPGDYTSRIEYEFIYPLGQFSSDAFHPIVFPGTTRATKTAILFDILGPYDIIAVNLVVPEPTSLLLSCVALSGCTLYRRRRRTRAGFAGN